MIITRVRRRRGRHARGRRRTTVRTPINEVMDHLIEPGSQVSMALLAFQEKAAKKVKVVISAKNSIGDEKERDDAGHVLKERGGMGLALIWFGGVPLMVSF